MTKDSRRQHDARRDAEQPWRRWYKTARWQRLAPRVYRRDGYVCRQTGALLRFKHPHPLSPVADHIIPHRGDPALFWNENNVQTVAKSWHDSDKAIVEGRGFSTEIGLDGLPVDPQHPFLRGGRGEAGQKRGAGELLDRCGGRNLN